MNQSNNAEESMNFSVIDKNQSNQGHFDFSVQSLLENNESSQKTKEQKLAEQQTTRLNIFSKVKKVNPSSNKNPNSSPINSKNQVSQNFLKDLSRMQKELSFESDVYNIYEENPSNSIDYIQNNKSKTLSYLKVTKDTNKSMSKDNYQDYNEYYGELIIDFHHKDNKNKEKTISKIDSKGSSTNLLSQRKCLKNSKSHHEVKTFFRLKENKSASKSKFAPIEVIRKSKSKSLSHKIGLSSSKTQSQVKISAHTETMEEKVFTEYYGTQTNFRPEKYQIKRKKETVTGLKSKQKSSKSKLGLLSPKSKPIPKVLTKK